MKKSQTEADEFIIDVLIALEVVKEKYPDDFNRKKRELENQERELKEVNENEQERRIKQLEERVKVIENSLLRLSKDMPKIIFDICKIERKIERDSADIWKYISDLNDKIGEK